MDISNPCTFCADYPYQCRGLCKDKMEHMNEVDESTPVVKKQTEPKKTHIFYEGTKAYEYNKNGIKREIRS